MDANVATIATYRNTKVAITAADGRSVFRYSLGMSGAWVQEQLSRTGMSQAALARALSEALGRKITRDFINKIIMGRRRLQLDEMRAAARIFGIQMPTDADLRGEPQRVPVGQEFSPDPDFETSLNGGTGFAKDVEFKPSVPRARPEIDAKAGAGQGALGENQVVAIDAGGTVTGHRVVGEWVIPDAVYRSELHAAPGAVFVMAVDGESMRPTLEPGDRIFVDGQRTTFTSDGIYLIDDGDGEPRVKRLEKVLFSQPPEVVVRSDNPGHGEQTVPLEALRVLGKVCGRLTRM